MVLHHSNTSMHSRDIIVVTYMQYRYKHLPQRDAIRVGFNPVECYVKELRVRLGPRAQVFYDALGSDIIAIVWSSDTFASAPFRIADMPYSMPIDVCVLLVTMLDFGTEKR